MWCSWPRTRRSCQGTAPGGWCVQAVPLNTVQTVCRRSESSATWLHLKGQKKGRKEKKKQHSTLAHCKPCFRQKHTSSHAAGSLLIMLLSGLIFLTPCWSRDVCFFPVFVFVSSKDYFRVVWTTSCMGNITVDSYWPNYSRGTEANVCAPCTTWLTPSGFFCPLFTDFKNTSSSHVIYNLQNRFLWLLIKVHPRWLLYTLFSTSICLWH